MFGLRNKKTNFPVHTLIWWLVKAFAIFRSSSVMFLLFAGDEIVLGTTDYSMYHSEVRRIKEIIPPSQIMLSGKIAFEQFM